MITILITITTTILGVSALAIYLLVQTMCCLTTLLNKLEHKL